MSIIEILNTIVIGPLKLVFELVFSFAYALTSNPGLSIIFLSLAINIMILPLYMKADIMQKRSRDKELELRNGINHIKKSFSGDERMMILNTYYKQNNYSPFSVIQSSISLLLQIPFFMAAVQVLSNIYALNNASFGPIANLGAPDALITIGGTTINVLPILMTIINLVSSALFSKGGTAREKVQLYGLALFFLVFLYNYPSGLVFYWLLNNVFSLVKTIFYKLKNPKKVLSILCSVLGFGIIGFIIFIPFTVAMKNIVLVGFALLLQLPAIILALRKKVKHSNTMISVPNNKVFSAGTIFLTIFLGIFIPSTFIAASPQEFVFTGLYMNPIWYIVSSTAFAIGTFLLWARVLYWLSNEKIKVLIDKLIWAFCGIAIINYMLFGTDFGNISWALQYDTNPFISISKWNILINLIAVLLIFVVCYFTTKKKITTYILTAASVALFAMSSYNAVIINKSVSVIAQSETHQKEFGFNMSKEGKNVVVFMLDRAIGPYIPYIFDEKPELNEQFAGFTYYSNVASFGGNTNFCIPSVLGGYEYTPVEINKRDTETLMDKHNEAHLVMPTIFSQNDFETTVVNPVYINYEWISDLSFFDKFPEITAIRADDSYIDKDFVVASMENNKRNFFCFSLMKSMPLAMQSALYQGGLYRQVASTSETFSLYAVQKTNGKHKASGCNYDFITDYNILNSLSETTKVLNDNKNTFMFLANEITHSPTLLQLPDYIPESVVDNTDYDHQYQLHNEQMKMETLQQITHYHVNMAAMIQIGEWLDFLRENGIYDNTRIIIVSDHGYPLDQFEELLLDSENEALDLQRYMPLLLVKDFNSNTYTTSNEFMTNADVPSIAFENLIDNPVNPFTGININTDAKKDHDQFIIATDRDNSLGLILPKDATTFPEVNWLRVKDDMWNKDNFNFLDEAKILKEHQFSE